MEVTQTEVLGIQLDEDIVRVRHAVRTRSVEIGLSLVDQTKIVTAASELARNTLTYGRGGTATIEIVEDGVRRGLRIHFEDNGPGIPDIEQALVDGFTSGGGLGLGLSGARRLSNDFAIESKVGVGTRVTITRWKP